MATSQPAILGDLQKYQWYVHMSRTEGADLDVIKAALKAGQADAAAQGVNLCLLVGPTLAADLGIETDGDFQAYPGYESPDGKTNGKSFCTTAGASVDFLSEDLGRFFLQSRSILITDPELLLRRSSSLRASILADRSKLIGGATRDNLRVTAKVHVRIRVGQCEP